MRPLESVGERAHHRLLADQVGEIRRPVFARQHAVGAGGFAGLVVSASLIALLLRWPRCANSVTRVSPARQRAVNAATATPAHLRKRVGGWHDDPCRAR